MGGAGRRVLVESFLVKNLYPDDEIQRIAEECGGRQVAVLALATMAVALDRRFPTRPDKVEISKYARYLGGNYGSEERKVQPDVVEALVRASLGESGLLRGLTSEQMVPHEILIAYDIFVGLDLDEAGFNAFVDEALEWADDVRERAGRPLSVIGRIRQEVAVGAGQATSAADGLRAAVTHLATAAALLADVGGDCAGTTHERLVRVQIDVTDLAGRLESASAGITTWADRL